MTVSVKLSEQNNRDIFLLTKCHKILHHHCESLPRYLAGQLRYAHVFYNLRIRTQ